MAFLISRIHREKKGRLSVWILFGKQALIKSLVKLKKKTLFKSHVFILWQSPWRRILFRVKPRWVVVLSNLWEMFQVENEKSDSISMLIANLWQWSVSNLERRHHLLILNFMYKKIYPFLYFCPSRLWFIYF